MTTPHQIPPSFHIEHVIRELLVAARYASDNAYVRYSEDPEGCGILTSDGLVIPGARVECASYPLTISGLLNAVTTSFAYSDGFPIAAQSTRPFGSSDLAILDEMGLKVQEDGRTALSPDKPVPESINHFGKDDALSSGVLAVDASRRARTPNSDFPVGAVIATDAGRIHGANVEFDDWSLGLCAERNAVSTAVTLGLLPAQSVEICSPVAPGASPCGACRQVLFELIPHGNVVLVGESGSTLATFSMASLLPSGFDGSSIPPPKNRL